MTCHCELANCYDGAYYKRMPLVVHIRSIREARGLQVKDLASQIGISPPHMSQIERGVRNLNNHLLDRIADALDVPHEALISSAETADMNATYREMRRLTPEDRKRVEAFASALAASEVKLEDN